MRLHDVLREECIGAGLEFSDKAAALRAVAEYAKQSPVLANVDERAILEGLEQREAIGSTGFGNGIAIPHCRLKDVEGFVVGVLTAPGGVAFDSLDEKPAKLIVFIVAPADDSNAHLRLLSAISQALHGKNAVKEILKANSAEVIRESSLRHAVGELDMEGRTGKRLVCVFVQSEKSFHEILEVFARMEESSAVVLKSENLRAHYAKIPLFEGLWIHEPGGFSHVIIAVVAKGLTNEMVRQIETRTGDLDKQSGVMIAVHDLFYTAGSLDP